MRNFDQGKKFGGRSSGRVTMHQATCDQCGKSCEVPFKPSGDKPIYCSDCFEDRGGKSSRKRSFDKRGSRGPSMHTAICDQCGKSCEVPFKPSSGKPIYCSDCFENKGRASDYPKRPVGRENEQITEKLEIISAKLDMIIKVLAPVVSKKSSPKRVVAKKRKASKPKKVVKKTKTS